MYKISVKLAQRYRGIVLVVIPIPNVSVIFLNTGYAHFYESSVNF